VLRLTLQHTPQKQDIEFLFHVISRMKDPKPLYDQMLKQLWTAITSQSNQTDAVSAFLKILQSWNFQSFRFETTPV